MAQTDPGWQMISISILIVSLGLMAIGFFLQNRKRHLILAGGEAVFSIFWLSFIPYYLSIGDFVNATLCLMSLPFFVLLAFHEIRCYQWKQELRPLNWIAGTTFIAAGLYFGVEYIPPVHEALVTVVAFLSAQLLNLFGYNASIASGYWSEEEFLVPLLHNSGHKISIVLACTGIQAIALFLGFILATKPDRSIWKDWAKSNLRLVNKKLKKAEGVKKIRLQLVRRTLMNLKKRSDSKRMVLSILYTAPVIFIANLFRNGALVYVTHEDKFRYIVASLPVESTFEFAHNYITKGMALVLMLFLFLLLFDVLPELHENFLGLMDVLRFHKKDNVKDGFVELPSK